MLFNDTLREQLAKVLNMDVPKEEQDFTKQVERLAAKYNLENPEARNSLEDRAG